MRNLTADEIQKLAARKGANRIAVENFLATLDPTMSQYDQVANAETDAHAYRWSRDTIGAIREGIALAYGGKK